MQLLVHTAQGSTRVVRFGEEATVEVLEERVSKKRNERIVAKGKPLNRKEFRLKDDYGLCENDQIWILCGVKGGALLGKPVKGRSKGVDFEEKFARQREYDAQNMKYQAVRAELKAKMDQENINSRMNRLKIQNQWRKIMRLAKVESLRKGIEILSQNHERDVDRKDAIIQMLDRDLEEAEDQYQTAIRSQLKNIDDFIDLQDARLLSSETFFQETLDTIQTDFKQEKALIQTQHALQIQGLYALAQHTKIQEKEAEDEAKQDHDQLREELKNRNLEDINMLRIGLDSQIEELEQQFESAHLNYLQNTDQRTHDFKFYTKKDQELGKDIEQKIRKIDRLQASLQHWRAKLIQNSKEANKRNSALAQEKNKISLHYQRLKTNMNHFRQSQKFKLLQLTNNAHNAKTKLEARLHLAEKILIKVELARKLESESELIAPFSLFGQTDTTTTTTNHQNESILLLEEKNYYQEENNNALQTMTFTKEGHTPEPWSELDIFLRKYNKVLLDKLAIEREAQRLEQENAHLQSLLQKFFDGVSVTDAVLKQNNSLFVVNGRTNLIKEQQQLPVQQEQPTVVEANHLVHTARVNTAAF